MDVAGYIVSGFGWVVIAAGIGVLIGLFVNNKKRQRFVSLVIMWIAGVGIAISLIGIAYNEQKLTYGLIQAITILVGCALFTLTVSLGVKKDIST